MKEGVLDILIYLFENYMDDAEPSPRPDRTLLAEELEHAGFEGSDVNRALQWLDSLRETPDSQSERATARAIRVFSAFEQLRLDADCRGHLMHLEHIGILSAAQRELVIDRLMALEADDIDIEKVKWVVLMVLFSQPGQEQAYARMEDLVFEERTDAIH
jgi:Smg protein